MTRFALIALTIMATCASASADPCFSDPYGVRKHSPDAYPMWTRRMPGHEGEKCWYPSTKGAAKWNGEGTTSSRPRPSNASSWTDGLPSAWVRSLLSGGQRLGYAAESESEVMPIESRRRSHDTRPRQSPYPSTVVTVPLPPVDLDCYASDLCRNVRATQRNKAAWDAYFDALKGEAGHDW